MENNVLGIENKRLSWIDLCRGIGILLVVLGHSMFPFKKYIYAFHMPLFFVLSGYLWKPVPDLKTGVYKNIKRYILPYFILEFLNLLIQTVILFLKKESTTKLFKYIIGIMYSRGKVDWMPNCSPLWFLTSLFVVVTIYNCVDKISKNDKFKNVLLVGIFSLGYFLSLTEMPKLIWNVDTALVAILFFHLGRIFKTKEKILEEKLTSYKFVVVFVLIIISIIAIYYNPLEEVSFNNNDYGDLFLLLLGSLPIILSIVLICKKISLAYRCRFIEFFGKNTLFIMGFDYFSGTLVNIVLNNLFDIELYQILGGWIWYFMCKIIILAIGVMVWSYFVSKIPNKKIKQILSF